MDKKIEDGGQPEPLMQTELSDAMIAARIDRLPNAPIHRTMIIIVALAMFFDSVDLNSFSMAAPALIHDWSMSINKMALITSAGFIGMFFGASIGGVISDRIGRKPALVTFVIISSLASLTTAFAPTPDAIFALRVVTGFGLAAGLMAVVTYISETFPAKSRGSWQGWAMVINISAIPITNLVATLVVPLGRNGWRWVFVWGALGAVFVLIAPMLPESPRWLARHRRFAQAETVLQRMEASAVKKHATLPEPVPVISGTAGRSPWSKMFSPTYRKRTFVLCAIWMLQSLGFYGFLAWAPTLLVKHGFTVVHSLTYFTLANIGAPVGGLLAALLSDRFERKYMIAIACCLITVFGLLYGLTFEPVFIVVFGFLIGMIAQTFVPLLYTYTAEQFPTDIRNSATGLTYGAGRIANAANSFIIAAIYTNLGYLGVFYYISAAWLVTALVIMAFGIRTTGKSLEVLNPLAVE